MQYSLNLCLQVKTQWRNPTSKFGLHSNFFALFVSSKLGLQDENLLSSARLKKKEFNKKIKETENLAQKILGGDYFLLFCA